MRRVSARRNKTEVKLTREEEEELLAEWKPEPLVTQVDPDHEALHVPIIDHKVNTGEIRIPDIQVQFGSEFRKFKYSGDLNTKHSN